MTRKREQNQMLAIDFFCGAGGMSLGLAAAGIRVLAGVDNEKACEQTYCQVKNSDGSHPSFICKDIFPKTAEYPSGEQDKISSELKDIITSVSNGRTNPPLVFAICAPCQPFTKITKIKLSEKGKFKRSNDKNLLLTMVGLIKEFRPDALLIENVEGISEGKEASVLSEFRDQINELGYDFDSRIINASNFSVPQHRKRTIGIALLKDKYNANAVVPEKDPNCSTPTVKEVLKRYPPLAAGEQDPKFANHRARGLNDLNLKRISCAPPGASNKYLFDTPYGDLSLKCHRKLKEKTGSISFSDTYTRMAPNGLAPTITTKCVSITNGRFGHYDIHQHRGISLREAAALQTFPDNFTFYPEDNLEFSATLIGNAVPPALAEFFGAHIFSLLNQDHEKRTR